LSTRKELLKKQPNVQAKLNVVESINKKDVHDSKRWLERKARDEFSTRQENVNEHS